MQNSEMTDVVNGDGNVQPSLGSGWHDLESTRGAGNIRKWRWMAAAADLQVRLASSQDLRVELKAFAIGQPRALEIWVDHTLVQTFMISTEEHRYETQPIAFREGATQVRLVCPTGTVVPRGDSRALSVAILYLGITSATEGRLDFDNRIAGKGWGDAEISPEGKAFRWMVAAAADVELPLVVDCDYRIEARIHDAITPETLASLGMSVDGKPLKVSLSADRTTASAVIPRAGATTKSRTLRFTVAKTISPAKLNHSTDHRTLGVAFESVAWKRN